MCRCSGQRSEASTLKFGLLSGPVIETGGVAPRCARDPKHGPSPRRICHRQWPPRRPKTSGSACCLDHIIMALSPASEDTRTPSMTRSALTGPFLAASEVNSSSRTLPPLHSPFLSRFVRGFTDFGSPLYISRLASADLAIHAKLPQQPGARALWKTASL